MVKRSVILFGGPLAGEEFEVEDHVITSGELRIPAKQEIDVSILGREETTIEAIKHHKYRLKSQLHPRWHMVDRPMFMFEYVGEDTKW